MNKFQINSKYQNSNYRKRFCKAETGRRFCPGELWRSFVSIRSGGLINQYSSGSNVRRAKSWRSFYFGSAQHAVTRSLSQVEAERLLRLHAACGYLFAEPSRGEAFTSAPRSNRLLVRRAKSWRSFYFGSAQQPVTRSPSQVVTKLLLRLHAACGYSFAEPSLGEAFTSAPRSNRSLVRRAKSWRSFYFGSTQQPVTRSPSQVVAKLLLRLHAATGYSFAERSRGEILFY